MSLIDRASRLVASLACTAAALFTPLACDAGGGGGSDLPSRNTPNYLCSANNCSSFFRWTTTPGSPSSIPLYIEVYDEGISDHDQRVQDVVTARSVWKEPLNNSGIPIDSYTRLMSQSSPYAGSFAVIRIKWVDQLPGTKLGITEPVFMGGELARMDITLALRNPITGSLLTLAVLRSTAIHEFGHAMGIHRLFTPGDAHSQNPGDVMYSPNTWQWLTLSHGDRSSVQQLYSMIPTYARKDA